MKPYRFLAMALAAVIHLSVGCTEPVDPVVAEYVPPVTPPATPPAAPPAKRLHLFAHTPTTLIGVPGAEVDPSPAVSVLGAHRLPVPGTRVTFEVISGGGSVIGASVTSDSLGIARPGGWTLGAQAGANVVRARLSPADSQSVEFTAAIQEPCVSPCATGAQLAFVREGNIYAANEDGSNLVRLTSSGHFGDPAWSPDGRQIAFVLPPSGYGTDLIYLMNVDGSGIRYFAAGQAPAWSPDGERIAFSALARIFIKPVRKDAGPTIRFGFKGGYNVWPAWSPDGRRIAFVSDALRTEGASEIYIANADGSNVIQLTDGYLGGSTRPAYTIYTQPAWSPDGLSLAVVACQEWQYHSCKESGVGVIAISQHTGATVFQQLAWTSGLAKPSWTANGSAVEFSRWCWEDRCETSLYRIPAQGGSERLVVKNGHSSARRP